MSGSPIGAAVVALTIFWSACLDQATLDRDRSEARSASLAEGPGVQITVRAEAIACEAHANCREIFLPGSGSDERVASLISGFSCTFEPTSGPFPRDSLLAFARRLRCYEAGDPSVPASWQPPLGEARDPADFGEEAYGQLIQPYGDVYLNTATRLDLTAGYAFCRYEAWGALVSTADDGTPRAMRHLQGASIMHWQLLLEPIGGGYRCSGAEAVTRLRVASATFDRPDPPDAGVLPVLQDVAILIEEPISTLQGSARGLRLVFILDAPFPPGAALPLGVFDERELWLSDGAVPVDFAVGRSCANADPGSGGLVTVAAELLDSAGATLGGLLVYSELGAERFECERDATGACRLLTMSELHAAAPCFIASGP